MPRRRSARHRDSYRGTVIDPVTERARSARIAVSALFCINGALIASFLPRLPAVKAELGLSNAALGAGIAFGPAGALLASSVAGLLVARFGSGRLAVAASAVYGLALPLVGLAPVWAAFAAAVFLFGVCDGVADVAQNAHGLRVQKAYGRSVINGFHAWWSIGGVVGGVSSAAAAGWDVRLPLHLGIAGGILAIAALVAGRWTLPGPDPGAQHADAVQPVTTHLADSPQPVTTRGRRRVRPALLTLVGVAGLTLLAAVVEDIPGSWGAVYLRESVGTTAGLAGLAFASFTAGMTAGRLVADRAVDRWGHVAVVRTGGVVAAAGLGVGLLIGTPWAGLAGFLLVGVGAAPGFPALFHAAGHRRGVRPADGVALVSWAARAGFLLAPPVVGLVADATSLTWAVSLGILAAVGVAAGAGTLRPRD
jgi:MFS family permease